MSDERAKEIAAVREALAKRDAAVAPCPFLKLRSPDSRLLCPLCHADSSELCRKRVIADADFVSAVRVVLLAEQSATGGKR